MRAPVVTPRLALSSIRALPRYAAWRGWTIALQVKEVGSGASQHQLRKSLLEAARRREIDVVLVWRLDRWGRSVTDLLATLAGTGASRSWFRFSERSGGPDDPSRARHGCVTGRFRRVRTGDFAGTGARRPGPRPAEHQEAGPAGNCGPARQCEVHGPLEQRRSSGGKAGNFATPGDGAGSDTRNLRDVMPNSPPNSLNLMTCQHFFPGLAGEANSTFTPPWKIIMV